MAIPLKGDGFMVNCYTIQEQLQNIDDAPSQENQLVQLLDTFIETFPVLNAFLFRYSHIGYLGEGIISVNSNNKLIYLNERDDIRSLPTIMAAIQERKAKFYTEREIFEKTSSRYIIDSDVSSFLIVPITFGSIVIGYIYSNQMAEDTVFNEKLLSEITLFGKTSGEILQNKTKEANKTPLSKRELQVMKKISQGETTKEIAHYLRISELTVKQYVKQALNKLGAQNRAHAVAEIFRRGIIY